MERWEKEISGNTQKKEVQIAHRQMKMCSTIFPPDEHKSESQAMSSVSKYETMGHLIQQR